MCDLVSACSMNVRMTVLSLEGAILVAWCDCVCWGGVSVCMFNHFLFRCRSRRRGG
jgi:hypothetical protein